MIRFDIITIFPDIFDSYFGTSIIKLAQQRKLIRIKVHDLRRWTDDKHKTVDGKSYGGGPGMILKIEPIYKALRTLRSKVFVRDRSVLKGKNQKSKVILLTPGGKRFDQRMAGRLSKLKRIIFICGRYEGVDQRVTKFVDEEISIGPYVLTGGEIPAMIIVDAVTRLAPGVIKTKSLQEETFSFDNKQDGFNLGFKTPREYPQYTRPEVFTYKDKFGKIRRLKVPKVLLSGDHQRIKEWRECFVH